MNEKDIRHKEKFNEYLRLVEDEALSLDKNDLVYVRCPVCSTHNHSFSFWINGFKYENCLQCKTLFMSPRPSFERAKKFYSESVSSKYWINEFFKPVLENRRRLIFKPRAEFVSHDFLSLFESRENKVEIGDIGAGFGLFLDELRKLSPDPEFNHLYFAIEPSLEMAEICSSLNFNVVPRYFEDTNFQNKFDILTAFEIVEHLTYPKIFFKRVYDALKEDGFFILTTLNGLGFDIVVSGNKSKSIFPPIHINFFNPDSIRTILEDVGFSIVEITTPGVLDWNIIEGYLKENKINDPFWKLLATKDDKCKDEFQKWLSTNNLSSHMRVVAWKKK